MVRASMADRDQDATPETETHVGVEHVHLVLSPIESDILVDALRSAGNVELAECRALDARACARHGAFRRLGLHADGAPAGDADYAGADSAARGSPTATGPRR